MTRPLIFEEVCFDALPRDPVSFSISEGTVSVVHTLSTSLLRAVARSAVGLVNCYAGRITVLGSALGSLSQRNLCALRRRTGSVLQPLNLLPNANLLDNVSLPLLYSSTLSLAEAQSQATAILSEFEIQQWAGFRPADIPADIHLVASLARALVRRPELVMVENPGKWIRADESARLVAMCRAFARTTLILSLNENDSLSHYSDDSIPLDSLQNTELT